MSITCPACMIENSDNASFCIACGFGLTPAGSSSSSSYHLPAGALLKQGRYKIEKTLGEGGFGITYKGTDSTNSLGVAIKELRQKKRSDREILLLAKFYYASEQTATTL